MRAIIFANGKIEHYDQVLSELKTEDLLIAADGGAEHCRILGIQPEIVIGDMDSLSEQLMDHYQTGRTKLIRFPEDKDQTDLELALSYAHQQGAEKIILYGILGGRLDLSLANLLLLARDEWEHVSLIIQDGPDTAYLLRGEDSITINGNHGDIVSLIPLTDKVGGVSTSGLRWHLEKEELFMGNTRSVSNELIAQDAEIKICYGKLLLVHRSVDVEGAEE